MSSAFTIHFCRNVHQHYKEICEKCLRSNYVQMLCVSQPIKINGKSSAYCLSLFLCWCDTSSWRAVWCHTFRHGQQKSPKNWRSKHYTSHAWHSALIVQCTEMFLHNTLPWNFGVLFFGQDLSPRSSLSASHFSMATWNDWKRKSSCQEVTHKSGNWTECYNWSPG